MPPRQVSQPRPAAGHAVPSLSQVGGGLSAMRGAADSAAFMPGPLGDMPAPGCISGDSSRRSLESMVIAPPHALPINTGGSSELPIQVVKEMVPLVVPPQVVKQDVRRRQSGPALVSSAAPAYRGDATPMIATQDWMESARQAFSGAGSMDGTRQSFVDPAPAPVLFATPVDPRNAIAGVSPVLSPAAAQAVRAGSIGPDRPRERRWSAPGAGLQQNPMTCGLFPVGIDPNAFMGRTNNILQVAPGPAMLSHVIGRSATERSV